MTCDAERNARFADTLDRVAEQIRESFQDVTDADIGSYPEFYLRLIKGAEDLRQAAEDIRTRIWKETTR